MTACTVHQRALPGPCVRGKKRFAVMDGRATGRRTKEARRADKRGLVKTLADKVIPQLAPSD